VIRARHGTTRRHWVACLKGSPAAPWLRCSLIATVAVAAASAAAAPLSADGFVAFTSSRGVFVASPDGSGARLIPGTAGSNGVVWSPDGSRLAIRFDQSWRITGPQRAATTRLAGMAGRGSVAWSPTADLLAFAPDCALSAAGATVVFATPGAGVRTVRIRLVKAERPANGDATELGLWGFSPDGRWVLVTAGAAGDSCIHGGLAADALYVISVRGTEQRRIPTADPIWSAAWSPDGREIGYSPVCFRDCSALAVPATGGKSRVLFSLTGRLNQDPSGLSLEWLPGVLVVGAELDRSRAIYAVTPGRPRRVLGQGSLVQCACADRVAFDTGERLVIVNPGTNDRLTYPRRFYPGATDESVYLGA
jgi:Tol biopolymer transport system component